MAKQGAFDDTSKRFREIMGDELGAGIIFWDGARHIYREGAWYKADTAYQEELDKKLKRVCEETNFPFSTQEKSLWRTIDVDSRPDTAITWDAAPRLVCANGVLDINTMELLSPSPEMYITRSTAIEYNPKVKCREWLKMLDRIWEDRPKDERQECIDFVQEYLGVGLVSKPEWISHRGMRKMLILIGPSGTGKSTIASMFRRFFNPDRVCSATMDTLSKQFGAANLLGKLAIVSDDAISKRTVADTNLLKKLVTGEDIAVERKYMQAATLKFNGPILFTANSMPDVSDDDTDAVFKRLVAIECTRPFGASDRALLTDGDAVAHIAALGELPGVLNWALAGYKRAEKRGELLTPKIAASLSEMVRGDQNPTYDFLKRYCSHDAKVYNESAVLSAAVSVFAMDEHGVKLPRKSASAVMARIVAEAVPGVTTAKASVASGAKRLLVGLRLNDDGKAWVTAAKEKGLFVPGARVATNEKRL